MNNIDFSMPREEYFKDELNNPKRCPKCGSILKKEYASYMISVKGKKDVIVMGNDAGSFCLKCPIIVLDKYIFGQGILAAFKNKQSVYFNVAGIVNLDAVPENKKSVPFGDDNPIPLVEFIEHSEKDEKLTGIQNNGVNETTNLPYLIQGLIRYDNIAGYKLKYKTVKNKLSFVINQIVKCGDACLDDLHNIIKNEETWSCLFALEILKKLKNEKSIPFLIEFIKKNEEGDYWESCEKAMYALNAIGKPAMEPLINELTELFKQKIYYSYLVGALTRIKNEKVYSFMVKTVEDYMQNQGQYKDWFEIEYFTFDFEIQENKEVIPLLFKLLESCKPTKDERMEIEDTIAIIEDPVKFNESIKPETKELMEKLEQGKKKLGRNDICHCGSGIKYKKCCLDEDIKKYGHAIKI